MKLLSLLIWVGQFGFSILFPLCFFLLLATWLRAKFELGMWIVIVFGIIGLLTTVRTVRSCLEALKKASEEVSSQEKPPLSFNDHD